MMNGKIVADVIEKRFFVILSRKDRISFELKALRNVKIVFF